MGINVAAYRYAHTIVGGALAGVGGACFSLAITPQWVDGLTQGAGWIAIALVIFAFWRPDLCLVGAYFFGAFSALPFTLQARGVTVAPELFQALPVRDDRRRARARVDAAREAAARRPGRARRAVRARGAVGARPAACLRPARGPRSDRGSRSRCAARCGRESANLSRRTACVPASPTGMMMTGGGWPTPHPGWGSPRDAAATGHGREGHGRERDPSRKRAGPAAGASVGYVSRNEIGCAPSHSVSRPSSFSCSCPSTSVAKWFAHRWPAFEANEQ